MSKTELKSKVSDSLYDVHKFIFHLDDPDRQVRIRCAVIALRDAKKLVTNLESYINELETNEVQE